MKRRGRWVQNNTYQCRARYDQPGASVPSGTDAPGNSLRRQVSGVVSRDNGRLTQLPNHLFSQVVSANFWDLQPMREALFHVASIPTGSR